MSVLQEHMTVSNNAETQSAHTLAPAAVDTHWTPMDVPARVAYKTIRQTVLAEAD